MFGLIRFIGLFGVIGANGTVKNLKLTGVNIKGRFYVGAVAGRNNGTIESCSMKGNITSSGNCVGGIAGENNGSITGCSATGSVNGNSAVGGIAGSHEGGTLIDCHSSATVEGNRSVGGVVGSMQLSGMVIACSSTGNVEAKGTEQPFAGGVVGYVTGCTITACYATGNATAPQDGNAGGLVGYINRGTITACYWSGENTTGVGSGNDSGATKVDNSNITWETAAKKMNKEFTDYQWVINTDEGTKEKCPLKLEKKEQ